MKRVLSKFIIASGLALGCSVLTFAHAADVSEVPDAEKGEQLYVKGDMSRGVLACVTCHGEAGNSTQDIHPSLAAMPYEYIVKQMHDFVPQGDKPAKRRGKDGAPSTMAAIAGPLTDEDIRNISYYLSLQPLDWETAAQAADNESLNRGRVIWRGGIMDRGVAACAACHGADGAGIPGEFPRLAGQHIPYLVEQLKLFRSGDRDNSAMMHDLADRMNDKDIEAVANFAAGLRRK